MPLAPNVEHCFGWRTFICLKFSNKTKAPSVTITELVTSDHSFSHVRLGRRKIATSERLFLGKRVEEYPFFKSKKQEFDQPSLFSHSECSGSLKPPQNKLMNGMGIFAHVISTVFSCGLRGGWVGSKKSVLSSDWKKTLVIMDGP